MKFSLKIFFCLFLSFFSGSLIAQEAQKPETLKAIPLNHSVFSQLLKRYVNKEGLVDYRAFKKNKEALQMMDAYTEDMMKIDGLKLEPIEDRKAYWLNLYNALVLNQILKAYPIQNVSQISHFFDGARYEIAAFPKEKISLINLEERIFQEKFPDARLHLVRVNGSLSGPVFLQEAFEAATVEKKIEEAVMAFLVDPSKNYYDFRRNVFYASPLFLWFDVDFSKYAVSNRSFIQSRLMGLPASFALRFTSYDWRLNDTQYR